MTIYDKNGNQIDPTANVDGSQQAITIDRENPPTTNSKDILKCEYLGGGRTNADNPLHGYTVENYSGKDGIKVYTVSLFLSNDRKAILAVCNCQSWRVCKHIVESWSTHVQAETAGFVPTFHLD